jgi:hypothetical protein
LNANEPTDVRELQDQLEAAVRDAEALVTGLSEERGTGRTEAGAWSVAECLDHLATGNRVYLGAMREPANRARTRGRRRWRPARPGWVGRLLVGEPFVRGIRFSLATGLHVIAAHERRHLWQAWRVRRALERADGLSTGDRAARRQLDHSPEMEDA